MKPFGAKPGLLIYFHGQGHDKNTTEIGFLIKKEELYSGKYGNWESFCSCFPAYGAFDLSYYLVFQSSDFLKIFTKISCDPKNFLYTMYVSTRAERPASAY